jgi:hypothetical protein
MRVAVLTVPPSYRHPDTFGYSFLSLYVLSAAKRMMAIVFSVRSHQRFVAWLKVFP